MKIKRFEEINEIYEQKPKNWKEGDSNYYTFTCDITVRANSMEEAEDKMEFIANANEDVELGAYALSYATENGKSYKGEDLYKLKTSSRSEETLESKK